MKKPTLISLALASLVSGSAWAESAEDIVAERNKQLASMEHINKKLALQAQMATHLKTMAESQFIVDEQGNPVGIGDMDALAREIRRNAVMAQSSEFGNELFGGNDPVAPGLIEPGYGSPQLSPFSAPPVQAAAPAPAQPPAASTADDPEVVTKPSEEEKQQGRKLLRLAEIRGNSALFFTNDGFIEVPVGGQVYEQKLVKLDAESATLKGENGNRIIRIDWTQPVRFSDN